MKILIANRDRTDEMAERLSSAAKARPDRLHRRDRMPELTALRLIDARSEDEFLGLFIEHLRRQHGRFAEAGEDLGGRRGLGGRLRSLAQAAIARVTRGQRARTLARQGLLTELLLAVMELQQDHHRRDIERLEARLGALEAAPGDPDDRESVS